MDTEIILDECGLALWYYPETRIVHHLLRKYPGVAALQSALEAGLGLLRNRGACKWLSDDRRGGALPRAHLEWGLNVWGPSAAAAGWKYWALIPPSELLGSANMRRVAEIYAGMGVTTKTFTETQAAMDWLVACP
jgi:hypothetical protein